MILSNIVKLLLTVNLLVSFDWLFAFYKITTVFGKIVHKASKQRMTTAQPQHTPVELILIGEIFNQCSLYLLIFSQLDSIIKGGQHEKAPKHLYNQFSHYGKYERSLV